MDAATVTIDRSGTGARAGFSGRLVLASLTALQHDLADLKGPGDVVLDLGKVEAMDTGGAWLILDLTKRLQAEGVTARLENVSDTQNRLIETVRASLPAPDRSGAKPEGFVAWVASVGETTIGGWLAFVEILSFFGELVACFAGLVLRPWRMRWTSLVYQMQQVGFNAVPIVALMGFLIGIVLAFQGAAQLRQFGAGIFIVDLIAIAVLRELGILLTSIIVAGRTGSAFTASIGSMKMREEIDAMRTLGLNPFEVLIVPRVLALVITLPILGLIASLCGLIGGALMSWVQLGLSPEMFVVRLSDSIGVWNYAVGMIKAPFFAVIIGVIGCYQGMKVEGNAESLGQRTSQSVVLGIFLVIAVDAMFSIFFSVVGV